MRVLITGATSGIGLSSARAFARTGADLVLTGRRTDRLAEVKAELPRVETLLWDVRDAEGLKRVQQETPDLLAVDVLVNNAGLALGTDPIQAGDPDEWDVVLDTNVRGLLRLTRAVLPGMIERRRGHVVNLGSTAGRLVYPGGTVYCASKFAVRAISEGIRMDVHGSGVRVTNIEPGLVETEFSDVRFRGDKDRAGKVYQGYQPLTADDIAETILWCVQRPPHVNVQELVIYPTAQASVGMLHKGP